MKLSIFLIGGFLIWLGAYGYTKTKHSIGMRPIEGSRASAAYTVLGGLGQFLVIPYVLMLGFQFEWWIAAVFVVVGGLLTGMLYSILMVAGAALPLIGVPLGVILCLAAFAVE